MTTKIQIEIIAAAVFEFQRVAKIFMDFKFKTNNHYRRVSV